MTNLNSLPLTSFANLSNLPFSPGVYIVLSGSEEVLYVGITKNLNQRWNQEYRRHHRHDQLIEVNAQKICWIEVPQQPYLREALERLENKLIRELSPIFNNTDCGYSKVTPKHTGRMPNDYKGHWKTIAGG